MKYIYSLLIFLAYTASSYANIINPIISHRGHSHVTTLGPQAYACGTENTNICADYKNGQTFLRWPDPQSGGVVDYNKRARVYRSTSPITSSNYTSATLLGSYIIPNSGQLFGGNPDVSGGSQLSQANRQSTNLTANPMSKVPDAQNGGTQPLAYGTGLFVNTVPANENAYYAVVITDTTNTNPSYLGSVGPIAEVVAEPQPVIYASSGTRTLNTNQITSSCASGCPLIFNAHASSATVGTPSNSQLGDYWEVWGLPNEGWFPGRATTWAVHQEDPGYYPSFTHSLVASDRDTWFNGTGTGTIENFHFGVGLGGAVNPLSGPPNTIHPGTARMTERMLNWIVNHYNADPFQVHWTGQSMGAWGGIHTGLHMTNPKLSTISVSMPVWRQDRRACYVWPGAVFATNDPFRATVSTTNNCFLGLTASSVYLDTGERWGGDGGYTDMPAFVASNRAVDLPFTIWMSSKDDPYPNSLTEQIEAINAFELTNRGYAVCWFMGLHDTGAPARGLIDYDWTGADISIAYKKTDFKLNLAYLVTSNSSINDYIGTGSRLANGLYDGDHNGCNNAGFRWTITDTLTSFNFTINNGWMSRSPTAEPSTTLTGSIASGSGSGQVTVTNASVFQSIVTNPYFLIGNEVVTVTALNTSTNTITYYLRGLMGTGTGTVGTTHSIGETVTQFLVKPTGPVGGPYSTMTVDITPRRVQNFKPATGANVHCVITPTVSGVTTKDVLVDADGLWTLTGVPIDSSGSTSGVCNQSP